MTNYIRHTTKIVKKIEKVLDKLLLMGYNTNNERQIIQGREISNVFHA